jgi:anti-sigma regulatory factor (Ser/Thr protein kinase)
MQDNMLRTSLTIPLSSEFLRLATSFAEESALALGLRRAEAMKLTLACEEIYSRLCQVARKSDTLAIEAAGCGYYVKLRFLFKADDFNFHAFNITSTVSSEDGDSLEEMGLLIASRSVEEFLIEKDDNRGFSLTLVKENGYPDASGMAVPDVKPLENFRIVVPDAEGIKLFVRLVSMHYPSSLFPQPFQFPGKVVDMVASGEYGAMTAVDDQGQTGGGVFWRRGRSRAVELFGPFVFNQPEPSRIAGELVEACMGSVAKIDAIGLISRSPTPEFPQQYFELLGTFDTAGFSGEVASRSVFYHNFHEDPGGRVWSHPDLEPFLASEYRRLFLAREIRATTPDGERRSRYSVFSPRFDRANRRVTLRAVWDGADAEANLERHLNVLQEENIKGIFFEIDLAFGWQARLSGILLAHGFIPRFVIPFGGEADLVVLQHGGG